MTFNLLLLYSKVDQDACVANNNMTTFFNHTCMDLVGPNGFCATANETWPLHGVLKNNTHCFDANGEPVKIMDVVIRTYASEDYWNR